MALFSRKFVNLTDAQQNEFIRSFSEILLDSFKRWGKFPPGPESILALKIYARRRDYKLSLDECTEIHLRALRMAVDSHRQHHDRVEPPSSSQGGGDHADINERKLTAVVEYVSCFNSWYEDTYNRMMDPNQLIRVIGAYAKSLDVPADGSLAQFIGAAVLSVPPDEARHSRQLIKWDRCLTEFCDDCELAVNRDGEIIWR